MGNTQVKTNSPRNSLDKHVSTNIHLQSLQEKVETDVKKQEHLWKLKNETLSETIVLDLDDDVEEPLLAERQSHQVDTGPKIEEETEKNDFSEKEKSPSASCRLEHLESVRQAKYSAKFDPEQNIESQNKKFNLSRDDNDAYETDQSVTKKQKVSHQLVKSTDVIQKAESRNFEILEVSSLKSTKTDLPNFLDAIENKVQGSSPSSAHASTSSFECSSHKGWKANCKDLLQYLWDQDGAEKFRVPIDLLEFPGKSKFFSSC